MSETQETPAVKIKGKRGGPRPGPSRKPTYLKRLGIKTITAAEILATTMSPSFGTRSCITRVR